MLSLVAPGIGDQKFTSQQAHYGQFTIALVFFFSDHHPHMVCPNIGCPQIWWSMVSFVINMVILWGYPASSHTHPYSTLWLPCPFLYCIYHLSQRKHNKRQHLGVFAPLFICFIGLKGLRDVVDVAGTARTWLRKQLMWIVGKTMPCHLHHPFGNCLYMFIPPVCGDLGDIIVLPITIISTISST